MSQLEKVKAVLADGSWHSPEDIAVKTDGAVGTVMSRLRDLRTEEFGALKIEKQYAGAGNGYHYRWTEAPAAGPVTMVADPGQSFQRDTLVERNGG